MALYTYVPSTSEYEVDVAHRAFEAFARSQGFPAGISSATNLREPVAGGAVLQDVLSRVGKGDTLLIQSLGALGSLPSAIERNLLLAVASGVALHVLDIGRVETALVAIRAALDAGAGVERELLELRAHLDKLNERHKQELEDHGTAIVERMTSVFGTRNFLSHVKETEQANGVGIFIRRKRDELGLTQAELAQRVGVSKSTIQRAESTGTAEDISGILAALTDNPQAQGAST
jgi:DNA-binding transcriptional regulator YiaG